MDTGGEKISAGIRRIVLETWRKALDNPGLAPDDDFFEAGGHSMLALRIVFELEDRLQAEIQVDQLFEHATARRFADHLARGVLANDSGATD